MPNQLTSHFKKEAWISSLFFALMVFRKWFLSLDYSLTKFDNLQAGIATFNLSDVGARINTFYLSIAVLGILFFTFWLAISFLFKKNNNRFVAPFINRLSVIGILVLFLELLTAAHLESIWLVIFLMIAFLLYAASNKAHTYFLKKFYYLVGLSFSVSFLAKEILVIVFNTENVPPFLIIALVSYIFILIAQRIIADKIAFNNLIFILKPIFILPLVSVISDEVYLIFNQRDIWFISPDSFYTLLVVIVITLIAYRFFKNHTEVKSQEKFIAFGMPLLLLLGMVLTFLYQPIIDQSKEMYELANPANGIMRLFKFNELPILDALPSHLFSELFFKIIYIVLNGYSDTLDFMLYEALNNLLYYAISFWFLSRLLKNKAYVFLLVLLLPFLSLVVYSSHYIALLSIALLYNLFTNYSHKNLTSLAIWTIFMIIWRLDVGIANLISTGIILGLHYVYDGDYNKKFRIILKVTLPIIALSALVLIGLIAFYPNNIWENMQQVLSYFGGSQAHGFTKIAANHDRFFFNNYFIFPLLVVSSLVYLLIKVKTYYNNSSKFAYLSAVFLGIYYIFNLQRGLVRHSLLEGNDSFINSFIYLYAIAIIFLVIRNKNKAWGYLIILTLFIIPNVKFKNALGYQNTFKKFDQSFTNTPHIEKSGVKIKRCSENKQHANKAYADFKLFMENNFADSATFIDFSNTPMLYFYTQRNVPSYFNQYIQNTINEHLQSENIKYLNNFDIPVVVFSHVPEQWWDRTDNVPNTVRYNLIAQYIFDNYKPFKNINGYYIWIKKSINPAHLIHHGKEVKTPKLKYDLLHYPYALGQSGRYGITNYQQLKLPLNNKRVSITKYDKNTSNYLLISANNISNKDLTLSVCYGDSCSAGTYTFIAKANTQNIDYIIPINSQYPWVFDNFIELNIDSKNALINQCYLLVKKTNSK